MLCPDKEKAVPVHRVETARRVRQYRLQFPGIRLDALPKRLVSVDSRGSERRSAFPPILVALPIAR
jgi:hypothetical protein